MPRAIVLFLLSVHGWSAAHAAGPLDRIDSRLVFESFPHGSGFGIEAEATESQEMPGCQVKTFQVSEDGAPGQIVLALCSDGEFGPARIEATLAQRVAEAHATLGKLPAASVQALFAGAGPVPVALPDGSSGKALSLPVLGHGLALVPVGYALTPGKDAAIVVQAYLTPNAPRKPNTPIASLLQGIYRRLLQTGT